MSSFFTKPASERKRKRGEAQTTAASTKRTRITSAPQSSAPKSKRKEREESIESEDDESIGSGEEELGSRSEESSEGENETAAEKRLRLAEQYLENIREEADAEGFDAADLDRDIIAERLKEDVAEDKGKVYRRIADDYDFEAAVQTYVRSNHESITGIAAYPPYIYTVSTDIRVMKWEIPNPDMVDESPLTNGDTEAERKNPKLLPKTKPIQRRLWRGYRKRAKDAKYIGHTNRILCVACSPDGKFLATGGKDNRLVIWDAHNLKPIRNFLQHRDSVVALAFRRGTNQLFSASADRTIKIWSLDEMAYVETLFGHQDEILDVAALAEEKCISVGARDRTARLWKVVEESQLVFRGGSLGESSKSKKPQETNGEKKESYPEETIDRIAQISNDTFVTGSSNGALSLWSIYKKKPVSILPLAHGTDPFPLPELLSVEQDTERRRLVQKSLRREPRWITALRAVPYSDLVISASWDGWIRVWRVADGEKGRKIMEAVGVVGHVDGAHKNKDDDGDQALGSNENGNENENENEKNEDPQLVRGVINDLTIFERGKRGKDGLTIVAAVGKEHRLGRWKSIEEARNGFVMFKVPMKLKNLARDKEDVEANGAQASEDSFE
jgi:ribosomal RNA-processing protein 9